MKKVLLALGLWIGLSSVSEASVLLSDILTRARLFLKDQSTTASRQQFTDTQLTAFANDGQREFMASTYLVVRHANITLTAQNLAVNAPSDMWIPIRMYYTAANGKLIVYRTTQNKLDAEEPGWRLSISTPTYYYVEEDYSQSLAKFVFNANPVVNTVFSLEYVPISIDLALSTDIPFNGISSLAPYGDGLVDYVTCRAFQVLEENDIALPFCNRWDSFLENAKGEQWVPKNLKVNMAPAASPGQ